jgi:energy-coupling factor transporter ATP-binding protein EcfA2
MKIKNVSAQNYRAFNQRAELKLENLTLIFGHNNAGKSSLARLLPSVCKDTSSNKKFAFSPVTLSDWETNGRDFLFGKGESPTVTIEVEFEIHTRRTRAVFEVGFLADIGVSVVRRLEVYSNEKLIIALEWMANAVDINNPHQNSYRRAQDSSEGEFEIKFDGLIPVNHSSLNFSEVEKQYLCELAETFEEIRREIYWLGPFRHIPDRIEKSNYNGRKIGPTGSEVTQILAQSYSKKTALFEDVSAWFEEALKQKLVCIEGAFDGDALFSIGLSPLGMPGVRVPIADTGAGIAQILPIIVLGYMAKNGDLGLSPLLVIENPELHLHDSLHDDIGRFLAQISLAACEPTLIVETHSENLLLAIEIEVAAGRIKPHDVSINWVRSGGDGSIVEHIQLNEAGATSEKWPRSAFETAPNQAKKLFVLRQGIGKDGEDAVHP